jgi:L-aminopeptidase/D-esterase-like protein
VPGTGAPPVKTLALSHVDRLFEAAVETTAEAILSAMRAAGA